MADERIHSTDEVADRDVIAGPGARIREARERAGLSQQDLADRLHLNVSMLESLETDRFDALPVPAYVRGYLRAAARALDLDPEPLIAAFDAQGVREPKLDTPPVTAGPGVAAARRGHRRAPYVLGVVILAAVVVLIAYGWYERQAEVRVLPGLSSDRITLEEPHRAPLSTREDPPVTVPGDEAQPEPRAEPLQDIGPPPVIGDRGVEPEPEREAQALEPEAVEEAPPDIEPEPPVAESEPEPPGNGLLPAGDGADSLSLTFVDDSWVEIHDATDARLLVGLMRDGTERRVSGVAPFRVFLGNAPGVRVRINDEAYDPSPHTRSDNTARFVLERSR
ncbi:helix-turn-helix domain-containing protein [Thioalkalivibrio thiocyanodenitrificans]|uniref:helix-turn-helix domain-containing protein n=1 Tax=Thioalkalivibrio thiocyanodenitrificans TaxID=243063 RepID=UPI00036F69BB|nr:RodZ domain-containing protein [Thioalkalivibrio thiocyanodenitrificans]